MEVDKEGGENNNNNQNNNNSGGNGNEVAHSDTPVKVDSQIGGGITGFTPTMQVPVSVPSGSVEKPEKFKGKNFKRWQEKMLFYLTTLGLKRFLTELGPELMEGQTDAQYLTTVRAWKDSDYLCRSYVLSGLSDALYDIYRKYATAKALWNALDHKYKSEDVGAKKFVVGRFLYFKMVDSKPLLDQVEELQLIFDEIHEEGMAVGESFQVASIIHLLPPSWKDFKGHLKHKRKDMNLEELILRLRIEEDNRSLVLKEAFPRTNSMESALTVAKLATNQLTAKLQRRKTRARRQMSLSKAVRKMKKLAFRLW